MTELEEIKVRARRVIRHFERWADWFSENKHSINARDAQEKADLIKHVIDEEQKSWRANLFEQEE